jgi:hypothetical protein
MNDIVPDMDALAQKILGMFVAFDKESLDLHALFEAGGNDPDNRAAVLDTVGRLVKDGLLEERGNDFYALTASGIANAPLADKA